MGKQIVTVGSQKWKIRDAITEAHALQAISNARAKGTTHERHTLDRIKPNGESEIVIVMYDVVLLDEQGNELL